jgi:hypothetical protein
MIFQLLHRGLQPPQSIFKFRAIRRRDFDANRRNRPHRRTLRGLLSWLLRRLLG